MAGQGQYHPWVDPRTTYQAGHPEVDLAHLRAVLGDPYMVDAARMQLDQGIYGHQRWAADMQSRAAYIQGHSRPGVGAPVQVPRWRRRGAGRIPVIAYGNNIAWSDKPFSSSKYALYCLRTQVGIREEDPHAWAVAEWLDDSRFLSTSPVLRLHLTSTQLYAFWFIYYPGRVTYGCEHPGTRCQAVLEMRFDPVRIEVRPGFGASLDMQSGTGAILYWPLKPGPR